MQWYGKPTIFNRFLGQVDQDDPTNLPVGLAAVCRNTDFTWDSPGVTSAGTRAGINLSMRLTAKQPCTGAVFFKYSPELETESSFEMPIAFDLAGNLQREMPAGTGRMVNIPAGPGFTPPAASHMFAVSAGNKVWAAFSDLLEDASRWCCVNPSAIQNKQTQQLNPAGMKPVGWYWQPETDVLVGEYCCPSTPVTGNGHTYRCITAGATGVNAPTFLTAEGAEFDDGTARWQESTMVMANRLDPPVAPVLSNIGGGSWPAGQDVWVVLTLVNNQGETLPGRSAVFSNTPAAAAILCPIPSLASMAGWVRGLPPEYVPNGADIYVAGVAHGAPAPPLSAYQKSNISPVALGSNYTIDTAPISGLQPPSSCTARVVPGQLPTPTDAPAIDRDPAAGAFPAGRDVYVRQTYTNDVGETKAGPASSVVNTQLNDGISVGPIMVPENDDSEALFDILQIGIYEADVPTGNPAPPSTEFQLVGYYTVGATPVITASATGSNPPTSNSTGPGGAVAADTSDGGMNGGQGYRYAAALFVNTNETVSGFTQASVIRYIVDEDGWELAFFNIPTGPSNIVARLVAPTGADSSQSGPFNWIGLIDLIDPTQNIVYPQTTLSGDIEETATALFDNVTTTATLNFDDTFLANDNNVDDRLDILPPFKPIRVDFLKTINAMAFSGVKGYMGGGLIGIPGDYESVYADNGPLPFAADGQTCYGFSDKYKSTVFAMRSDGGYALLTNSGNPQTWQPIQRWDQQGPCGYRAWDAIGKFICFVNENGFFKYDESDPDLLAKEVPRSWARINWKFKHLIDVCIDEATHTVRVQAPTGQSTVPNEEFCLSYLEGWQNPIHFSTFSGKEISMDAARRWSFNDVAAYVCLRMPRTLANVPTFADGQDWETQPSSSFGISQLLYCSSGFDGGIHARTPGVYSDNGQGIDWRYETMSASQMQAVSKPEGFNLNCTGRGTIYAAFLPARVQVNGPNQGGEDAVWLEEIALDPDQKVGITRKADGDAPANEFWRVHFDNNKTAGAWCSLKFMTAFTIPITAGRDDTDE